MHHHVHVEYLQARKMKGSIKLAAVMFLKDSSTNIFLFLDLRWSYMVKLLGATA